MPVPSRVRLHGSFLPQDIADSVIAIQKGHERWKLRLSAQSMMTNVLCWRVFHHHVMI